MLSHPYDFSCVLRLRTSPEFRPGRSHDHFFPDPQYDNVQHIICCDTYATYSYDFDFENNNGFSNNSDAPPVLQFAFQYTVIVRPEENFKKGPISLDRLKYSLKRRLKIRTLQYGVVRNLNELYDSADT
jgi:hypothetical protein